MYIIGYWGDDKILLKIFKLYRIIPKKKKKTSLIFFKNLGGWGGKVLLGPHDAPSLTHY